MNKHLIFISIVMLIFLSFCKNIDSGKPGVSKNIMESKSRGVFTSTKNIIKCVNIDTLGSEIKLAEIWYEKKWNKGENDNHPQVNNDLYQFVINLDKVPPKEISDSIAIRYNSDTTSYLGIINSKIYATHLRNIEVTDTVKLDFYLKQGKEYKLIKTIAAI
jgi:hypothetical protein